MQPKKRLTVMLVRWAAGMSLVWAALIGAAGILGSAAPGRVMAYTPSFTFPNRIILRDLNHCHEHTLSMPVLVETMAWSPDGTQIAFIGQERFGNQSFTSSLYVMNWTGTSLLEIGDSPHRAGGTEFPMPAWLPDSKMIALPLGRRGIALYDLDMTYESEPVWIDTPFEEMSIAFSFDGQFAAFVIRTPNTWRIDLVDRNTRLVRELIESPFPLFGLRWLPDKAEFLYLSEERSTAVVRSYSLVTNSLTSLHSEATYDQIFPLSVQPYDMYGRLLLFYYISISSFDDPMSEVPALWILDTLGNTSPLPCVPKNVANFTLRP